MHSQLILLFSSNFTRAQMKYFNFRHCFLLIMLQKPTFRNMIPSQLLVHFLRNFGNNHPPKFHDNRFIRSLVRIHANVKKAILRKTRLKKLLYSCHYCVWSLRERMFPHKRKGDGTFCSSNIPFQGIKRKISMSTLQSRFGFNFKVGE